MRGVQSCAAGFRQLVLIGGLPLSAIQMYDGQLVEEVLLYAQVTKTPVKAIKSALTS